MPKIKMFLVEGDPIAESLMSLVLHQEKLGITQNEVDGIARLEVDETYTFKGDLPLKPITRVQ